MQFAELDYITAELTTGTLLVLFLLSGALAYALRERPKDNLQIDDTPTTISTRGGFLQLVIGQARVAPVVGWAGDRSTRQEGGGGKGVGKKPKQTVYYESAWHQLCIGPVNRLNKIIQSGEVIWEGPITRWDTPSGTEIEIDGEGTFVIYWGEASQPVNTRLGDETRVGVTSRWPYCCYIEWIDKSLGQAAYWSQLEYDIEADCVGSVLSESSCDMESTDADANNSGVNYAHAIYQLVTGDWPHGGGASGSVLDFGTLEALGVVCEDEHTPCSLIAKNGATVSDMLANLAADHGFTISQVGNVLVFTSIRPADSSPAFDEGHLAPPRQPEEFDHSRRSNRAVYSFTDNQRAFTRNTVTIDDDASYDSTDRAVQQIDMRTVADRNTADKVARRSALQLLSSPVQRTLRMAYTARVLHPGAPFSVDTIGALRCTSIAIDEDDAFVIVKAIDDKYSELASTYEGSDEGQDGGQTEPAPDALVALAEVPYSRSGDTVQLLVMRVRGSLAASSCRVWLSSNGTSYSSVATQNGWCFGGVVSFDHEDQNRREEPEGPTVTSFGYGTDVLEDLTGDDDSWRTGRQVAYVVETGEFMFVKKATSLSGDEYRLDGVIRGRGGSARQPILAGYSVLVFDPGQLSPIEDPLLKAGASIYVKTQPPGVALAEVTAVSRVITASAKAPYAVVIHRSGERYDSSGDAVIEWSYRLREGLGSAAGDQLAGVAIDSSQPTREGSFFVEIIDPSDGSVVRTDTVDSDTPSFTYTSAQRTTDFGAADPDFNIRVTNKLGSRSSPTRTLEVSAG